MAVLFSHYSALEVCEISENNNAYNFIVPVPVII